MYSADAKPRRASVRLQPMRQQAEALMIRSFALFLILNILSGAITAQNNAAPDVPEPGSVEAIAAATTEKDFLSPWVSYLPQSSTVPSPMKFLGRIPGAPGELVGTVKAYAYCRALAAA